MDFIASLCYSHTLFTDAFVSSILKHMPVSVKIRFAEYRKQEDANAYLMSAVLLRFCLSKAGIVGGLERLNHSKYGRPYLNGTFDFNLSHSGEVVVCIFSSNRRVGIDIERIRAVNVEEYRDVLVSRELLFISQSESELESFFVIWTKKEAVMKADGRGISHAFSILDVSNHQSVFVDSIRWNISELILLKDYRCHYAYNGSAAEFELIDLHAGQLNF